MSGITPARKVVLLADISEVTLKRQEWKYQRGASHIRRQKEAGAYKTEKVFLAAGDAWLLTPRFFDSAETLREGDGGQFINETDVDLAPGYATRYGSRVRSDLNNLDTDAAVADQTAAQFFKQVNANTGSLWDDAQLFADALSYPPPTPDPTQNIPIDRVLSGRITHPANCPFLLRWMLPPDWGGSDTFLQFYFGGQVTTTPDGTAGGEYCLRLRGNGAGVLFERKIDGTWRSAQEFEWGGEARAQGAGAAVAAMLGVVPYSNSRILITTPAGALHGGGGMTQLGRLATTAGISIASQTPAGQTLYRDGPKASGHTHIGGASGAGPIRLDRHRKDGRWPVSLVRGLFPVTGTLIDSPFPIPHDLPVGETLHVILEVSAPVGTSLVPVLHDAVTGLALSETFTGSQFFTTTAARSYFLRVTFSTTSIFDATPALFSYSVEAAGEFRTAERVPIVISNVNGVDLTGPGLEATSESGSVVLQDTTDQAALLRVRDRVRSTVTLLDPDTDAVISHLGEYEITQSPHTNRGDGSANYPGQWRELHLNLASLGRRLGEQFSWSVISFADTATSPIEYGHRFDGSPTPEILTWYVTDIIRFLIRNSGFPDDEIDVPHIPLRFWAGEERTAEDYCLQPGAFYGDLAQDLALNLLGGALVRDPNAGARGMWRLRLTPLSSSTNYLAYLHLTNPGLAGGTLATHYGAYPTGHTFFIRKGSDVLYSQAPRAPIYNQVMIIGSDDAIGSKPANLITATLTNFDSINNPDSLDYIGHVVPYVLYDPLLKTQEAVNWVCAQVYDRIGRATVWFEGVAPLLLVTDPLDALQVRPRPLRINDLIVINGYPAIVHSCGIEIHNVNQVMHLEGRYLN